MSSFARSIIAQWESNPALTALVPSSRVYVGRVPTTQQLTAQGVVQQYKFPYVSINILKPSPGTRTTGTMQSFQVVSFDIWVDDARLAFGELIAEAVIDAYANQCWTIDAKWKVLDCRAAGPASQIQVDAPTVKAWKLVQLFDVRLERLRADSGSCCTPEPDLGSSSNSYGSEEWPLPVASSESDNSQTGAWPEFTSQA